MDGGIFGTGLSFTQFLISLIILIIGTIAIKITFNFDINKYMESRQEKYSAKCKNACLHFEFVKKDDGIEVHSFFVSPSGTLNYICQRCGLIRLHLDREEQERTANYYIKNVKKYNQQNKKFQKLVKKAGYA